MRIELTEKDQIELYYMENGDTFVFKEECFMKIDEGESLDLEAVNLSSGKVFAFDQEDKVRPINLKVVQF